MKPIKTYQLFWLSVVCVFLFLGALGASLITEQDEDETLANSFGDVPWSHTLHAREAVANCQVCHHTSKTGESDMQACSDCHQHRVLGESVFPAKPNADMAADERKTAYAEWAKENGVDLEKGHLPADRRVAFHKKCAGCHQAVGEGPTRCRDCHESKMPALGGATEFEHRQYAWENTIACVRCHVEGQPTALPAEGEWNRCEDCHEGMIHREREGEAAYPHNPLFAGEAGEVVWDHRDHHLEYMDYDGKDYTCLTCHHMEEETANPQEYRRCSDCHKAKVGRTKDGKAIPARKTALHKRCFDCHDFDSPDLDPEMPVACNDCHREAAHTQPASFGLVTWTHDAHAIGADVDCLHCHHEDAGRDEMRSCRECHLDHTVKSAVELKQVSHHLCAKCHEQIDDEKLKVETCEACHVDPVDGDFASANRLFLEKHNPLAMERAMHKVCLDCHKEKKQGPLTCRGCHAYPQARKEAIAQRERAKNALETGEKDEAETRLLSTIVEKPLPPASMLGRDASDVHRVHVDLAGFPCMDCHHNMKQPASVRSRLLQLPKVMDCDESTPVDDCRPSPTDPGHCGACHQREGLGIPAYKAVRKKLCADCHEEFGLPVYENMNDAEALPL